jgi:hypothetical protein
MDVNYYNWDNATQQLVSANNMTSTEKLDSGRDKAIVAVKVPVDGSMNTVTILQDYAAGV